MEKGNNNNYMQDEQGSRMKRHWRCCFVQVSVRQDKDAVLLFKASRDSDHVLLLIALGRVEGSLSPPSSFENTGQWTTLGVYGGIYGSIWWYMVYGGRRYIPKM